MQPVNPFALILSKGPTSVGATLVVAHLLALSLSKGIIYRRPPLSQRGVSRCKILTLSVQYCHNADTMSPERWNAPLYLLLFVVIAGGFGWYTFLQNERWVDTIQAWASGVVVAVAVIYTVAEAREMLAEAFRKARWATGFKEGQTKGQREEWSRVAAELEKAEHEGLSASEARKRLTPPDASTGSEQR